MDIFGIRIEKISDADAKALERAKAILDEHGLKAIAKPKTNENKAKSANAAAQAKADQAKAKILEAAEHLKSNDKKINIANLSREAQVSRNTAKKYLEELEL